MFCVWIKKDLTSFYYDNSWKGYKGKCKSCCMLATKHTSNTWKQNNPEKASKRNRVTKLKLKYNLTVEHYADMLHSQQNGCAICGKLQIDKNLAVDHNHVTGNVRGLLCQQCNTGIGLLQDSVDILNNAIKYLMYHNSETK